jgi:hypothetical protein
MPVMTTRLDLGSGLGIVIDQLCRDFGGISPKKKNAKAFKEGFRVLAKGKA